VPKIHDRRVDALGGHGGAARRVISKLTRVPVQANAGLFRGCVLTNSHSTRRS